jgi:uroporphyrinogen-III decarboxylase
VKGAGEKAKGKFVLGEGISIYERLHFIRGLENTWIDIYENKDELCSFLDILVDMNLYAVEKYKQEGVDGYMFCDDWGLQDRLMISPSIWREIWKPRYKKVYAAAHKAGMLTFLHSCGYIVEILGDLIEAGLDVINMDQQENMGLELLGDKFGGKITFFSPVDIQKTMSNGTNDDIREYCRKMVRFLGKPEGGFIPKWYSDPVGAGHTQEAIDAMCTEFLTIDRAKLYNRN